MAVDNQDGLIGLGNILDSIYQSAEDQIVECVNDLVNRLQEANPIQIPPDSSLGRKDWGVSRYHWRAGTNEYLASDVEGGPPYIGGVEAEITMKSRGGRFLSAPRGGKGISGFNIRKATNIVVSNDAPYMAKLNRGHSPQAEPQWIEATIDDWMVDWRLI